MDVKGPGPTTNSCTINLRASFLLFKRGTLDLVNIWDPMERSRMKTSMLFECGPILYAFPIFCCPSTSVYCTEPKKENRGRPGMYVCMYVCICSAQSGNLHNLEIALRILGIPRLCSQSRDCVTRVRNLKIACACTPHSE